MAGTRHQGVVDAEEEAVVAVAAEAEAAAAVAAAAVEAVAEEVARVGMGMEEDRIPEEAEVEGTHPAEEVDSQNPEGEDACAVEEVDACVVEEVDACAVGAVEEVDGVEAVCDEVQNQILVSIAALLVRFPAIITAASCTQARTTVAYLAACACDACLAEVAVEAGEGEEYAEAAEDPVELAHDGDAEAQGDPEEALAVPEALVGLGVLAREGRRGDDCRL
ncbi:hypothetical protein VPNG_07194 [Cytospora leucostoma]|uniref:Uncharacterized protein n=1 Tax=Cytospora leucostoma TaxID=1230097 RepID=A0A423WJT0_9PEZI|nr:hypothetical protein VPNG_07194 [Cytospora leucostoma]